MNEYKDVTDKCSLNDQILYLYNFADEPRYRLQFHPGDVVVQSF